MTPDPTADPDSQDLAETFDETQTTADGQKIAEPDMASPVRDFTQAEGDAAPDELAGAEDGDFDPDAADEAEREAMLEADDGVDEPNLPTFDNGEIVATDDRSSADFESRALDEAQLRETGYRRRPSPRRGEERRLDEGLEETFPASDPVSINPGAD